MVTHEATRGQQLSVILEHWTLDELDDANCVLDAIDGSAARARQEAERQRKRGR